MADASIQPEALTSDNSNTAIQNVLDTIISRYNNTATTAAANPAPADQMVPAGPISQSTAVANSGSPDASAQTPAPMSTGDFYQGIQSAQQTLGLATAQTEAAIQAKIDATKQNAALQNGIITAYQNQQEVTDDALPKIQFLDRFSGLPGDLGEAGQAITGLLGMFDTDFNRKYQTNRIAAAQQRTSDVTQMVQAQMDVNNAQPTIASLQAGIAENKMNAIKSGLDLNKEYLGYLQEDLGYRASLTDRQQQLLRVTVSDASNNEVARRAQIQGPEQGVWQVENYRRMEFKDNFDAAQQNKSIANLSKLLSTLRPEELAAGIQQADNAGSDIIAMRNPFNHTVIQIPVSLAKDAYVKSQKQANDYSNMVAANYADRNSLQDRLAGMTSSLSFLGGMDPKLAGVSRAFQTLPKVGSQMGLGDMHMLNGMLNQADLQVQASAKAISGKIPTKEGQQAFLNAARTGYFTPADATNFLAATAVNPGNTDTSLFRDSFASLRKAEEDAVASSLKGGVGSGIFATMVTNPTKGKQMAMGQVLQDPAVLKQTKIDVTNQIGALAMRRAMQLLASDPRAAPVWKQLAAPENQYLWSDNTGSINPRVLADTLGKMELEATAANGPGGRNMRGVYLNTYQQALNRVRQNARPVLGADPELTVYDHALAARLFGGASPYVEGANGAYNAYLQESQNSQRDLGNLIRQDVNGQTVQRSEAAMAHDRAYMVGSPVGNPMADAFVMHKLQPLSEDKVMSSTGARLTVQQMRQLQQQQYQMQQQ